MKYHPNGSVLFLTFSLEEGLLLLANPLCEAIIKSCLARALHMHPVAISHYYVGANHVHLIIVVNNPDDVCGFIRYFKTESAHMLNAVLGREKRTVWCEGYDSPVVLTPIRALIAITYIYSNPAKDNLEESIEQYPGLSSWKMYQNGEHKKRWHWLRRPAFKELTKDSHNLRGYTKEAKAILADCKKFHDFTIDPNAWMQAFNITDASEQATINSRIQERVKALEARANEKRIRQGKTVIGRERLINQKLDVYYRSKRSGRRMWCLSEDRSIRISFINFLKDLIYQARSIRRRWFLGDYSEPYPLGLYPPSMPKLAEPLKGF